MFFTRQNGAVQLRAAVVTINALGFVYVITLLALNRGRSFWGHLFSFWRWLGEWARGFVSVLAPDPESPDPLPDALESLLAAVLYPFAPVVGAVKARAFKDNARSCAEKPLHISLSPRAHPALALRTGPDRLVLHRLEKFKGFLALEALILVGRHF